MGKLLWLELLGKMRDFKRTQHAPVSNAPYDSLKHRLEPHKLFAKISK
jgi:hypothetical protein